MGKLDTITAVNATLGMRAAKGAAGQGLEAQVKASMRAVLQGNWLERDESKLYAASLAGALEALGEDTEDGKRLLAAIEEGAKFQLFLEAVQRGLNVQEPTIDRSKLLPLLGWWVELNQK